jgi:hypothetical protein
VNNRTKNHKHVRFNCVVDCNNITYSLWKNNFTKSLCKVTSLTAANITPGLYHQHMSNSCSQHMSSRITTFSTCNIKANHQTWFSVSSTHLLFTGHIVLWHRLKLFFWVNFFPQVIHFLTGFTFLLIQGNLHKSQSFVVWYCKIVIVYPSHNIHFLEHLILKY